MINTYGSSQGRQLNTCAFHLDSRRKSSPQPLEQRAESQLPPYHICRCTDVLVNICKFVSSNEMSHRAYLPKTIYVIIHINYGFTHHINNIYILIYLQVHTGGYSYFYHFIISVTKSAFVILYIFRWNYSSEKRSRINYDKINELWRLGIFVIVHHTHRTIIIDYFSSWRGLGTAFFRIF